MAMTAVVVTESCVGCGACAEVCPVQAISLVDDKTVIGDNCVACGACIGTCPVGALRLE